jgi:hypothetical protein
MTTALSFTAATDALRAAGLPDYLAEDIALDLTHGTGFTPEAAVWSRFDTITREMAEF